MTKRTTIIWIAALVIFAASIPLSFTRNASAFQFVDRIVRPCGGTAGNGIVQVTTTNILINPCPGGQVTINGVPVTTGGGDVFGPASATDNAAARFNLTTGKLIQNSLLIIDDSGNATTPGSITTGNTGGASGALDLFGLTSGTVTLTVNNVAGTWTFTLPADDGTPGQFLQTNGSGVTSWQTVSGFTCGACTLNTIQKGNGAGNLANSRITDNGTDIIANSGAGIFSAGDTSFGTNGSYLKIDDPNKAITISADDVHTGTSLSLNGSITTVILTDGGPGGTLTLNGPTNQQSLGGASAAITFTQSSANTSINGTTITPAINNTEDLGSTLLGFKNLFLTNEATIAKAVRTGTASDTDLAGDLTVGAGGTITYTFTQTYASAPICVSSDTNAAPNITGASATTTTLTVTGTVGHVVNYICIGRN